jgi:hypothetical protein
LDQPDQRGGKHEWSVAEGAGMSTRRVLPLIFVLVASGCVTWWADARGWLGTRLLERADVLQVTFRPVDAATDRRLADVRVSCFMRGREQACSLVRDGRKLLVTIAVGVRRVEERGLFTHHASRLVGADDLTLHLMFIAPDYDRLVLSYPLGELAALAGAGEQRVALHRMPAAAVPGPEHAEATDPPAGESIP